MLEANMKRIRDFDLGFADAENYRRRENKELFNKIFLRTEDLDLLLNPSVSFLIGEKGTGKTAYAVYLSNNDYKNTLSWIRFIRETDYRSFVTLKQEKDLRLSDYVEVWKVILYLLMAKLISDKLKMNKLLARVGRLRAVLKAIDAYYQHAFAPEIASAFNFVKDSSLAVKLVSTYGGLEGVSRDKVSFSEIRFQVNLMYLQRAFEAALKSLRLDKNFLLFIDGIDIRPEAISYPDYLDCVKGLANAVWSINNDFFASIKDSPGRMRVILLARPDIFDSIGLQNRNTKLRDNSVLLDWRTTYAAYRSSAIFRVADKLLSSQQHVPLAPGVTWDFYFPFTTPTPPQVRDRSSDPSFISFLRVSYYRPRDILVMLRFLKDHVVSQGRGNEYIFRRRDFFHPDVKRAYSDYLLAEIRDQLSFYHSQEDYETFLRFFDFLGRKRDFTYEEFLGAFDELFDLLEQSGQDKPEFFESPDAFLQFLYDLNVLCYFEFSGTQSFMRWCFRERCVSNPSPKVRPGGIYRLHPGIVRALRVSTRGTWNRKR